MKKISIITSTLALLFIVMTSCTLETIEGSGILVTESRNVNNFTKIKSEGVFEVNISKGIEQSVKIIADNNIISYIKTRVVNNELQIYFDNDYNYEDLTVQIEIVMENLNGIKNVGIGNINASNFNEIDYFSIYNSGTGSISIEGTASRLDVVNEGSGNVLCFDFMVKECDVEIYGSGNVEINCSHNLNVRIEGSGNVYYKGFPTISTSIYGSGKVISDN